MSNQQSPPDEWSSALDHESGRLYYYNAVSLETSWHCPVPSTRAPLETEAPESTPEVFPIQKSLPEGWSAAADQATGSVYYYHHSGEISWVRPTESSRSKGTKSPLPDGWQQVSDPGTRRSYFSHSSGSTRWNRPSVSGMTPGKLPDGWRTVLDTETGNSYYCHTNGETRWNTPPPAMSTEIRPSEIGKDSQSETPNGWRTVMDAETGNSYYCHTSGATRWDTPSPVMDAAIRPSESRNDSQSDNPDGWRTVMDAETGKSYYCHTSGETRWDTPPPVLTTAARPTVTTADDPLSDTWYTATDQSTGETYYCHPSGDTSWKRPSGVNVVDWTTRSPSLETPPLTTTRNIPQVPNNYRLKNGSPNQINSVKSKDTSAARGKKAKERAKKKSPAKAKTKLQSIGEEQRLSDSNGRPKSPVKVIKGKKRAKKRSTLKTETNLQSESSLPSTRNGYVEGQRLSDVNNVSKSEARVKKGKKRVKEEKEVRLQSKSTVPTTDQIHVEEQILSRAKVQPKTTTEVQKGKKLQKGSNALKEKSKLPSVSTQIDWKAESNEEPRTEVKEAVSLASVSGGKQLETENGLSQEETKPRNTLTDAPVEEPIVSVTNGELRTPATEQKSIVVVKQGISLETPLDITPVIEPHVKEPILSDRNSTSKSQLTEKRSKELVVSEANGAPVIVLKARKRNEGPSLSKGEIKLQPQSSVISTGKAEQQKHSYANKAEAEALAVKVTTFNEARTQSSPENPAEIEVSKDEVAPIIFVDGRAKEPIGSDGNSEVVAQVMETRVREPTVSDRNSNFKTPVTETHSKQLVVSEANGTPVIVIKAKKRKERPPKEESILHPQSTLTPTDKIEGEQERNSNASKTEPDAQAVEVISLKEPRTHVSSEKPPGDKIENETTLVETASKNKRTRNIKPASPPRGKSRENKRVTSEEDTKLAGTPVSKHTIDVEEHIHSDNEKSPNSQGTAMKGKKPKSPFKKMTKLFNKVVFGKQTKKQDVSVKTKNKSRTGKQKQKDLDGTKTAPVAAKKGRAKTESATAAASSTVPAEPKTSVGAAAGRPLHDLDEIADLSNLHAPFTDLDESENAPNYLSGTKSMAEIQASHNEKSLAGADKQADTRSTATTSPSSHTTLTSGQDDENAETTHPPKIMKTSDSMHGTTRGAEFMTTSTQVAGSENPRARDGTTSTKATMASLLVQDDKVDLLNSAAEADFSPAELERKLSLVARRETEDIIPPPICEAEKLFADCDASDDANFMSPADEPDYTQTSNDATRSNSPPFVDLKGEVAPVAVKGLMSMDTPLLSREPLLVFEAEELTPSYTASDINSIEDNSNIPLRSLILQEDEEPDDNSKDSHSSADTDLKGKTIDISFEYTVPSAVPGDLVGNPSALASLALLQEDITESESQDDKAKNDEFTPRMENTLLGAGSDLTLIDNSGEVGTMMQGVASLNPTNVAVRTNEKAETNFHNAPNLKSPTGSFDYELPVEVVETVKTEKAEDNAEEWLKQMAEEMLHPVERDIGAMAPTPVNSAPSINKPEKALEKHDAEDEGLRADTRKNGLGSTDVDIDAEELIGEVRTALENPRAHEADRVGVSTAQTVTEIEQQETVGVRKGRNAENIIVETVTESDEESLENTDEAEDSVDVITIGKAVEVEAWVKQIADDILHPDEDTVDASRATPLVIRENGTDVAIHVATSNEDTTETNEPQNEATTDTAVKAMDDTDEVGEKVEQIAKLEEADSESYGEKREGETSVSVKKDKGEGGEKGEVEEANTVEEWEVKLTSDVKVQEATEGSGCLSLPTADEKLLVTADFADGEVNETSHRQIEEAKTEMHATASASMVEPAEFQDLETGEPAECKPGNNLETVKSATSEAPEEGSAEQRQACVEGGIATKGSDDEGKKLVADVDPTEAEVWLEQMGALIEEMATSADKDGFSNNDNENCEPGVLAQSHTQVDITSTTKAEMMSDEKDGLQPFEQYKVETEAKPSVEGGAEESESYACDESMSEAKECRKEAPEEAELNAEQGAKPAEVEDEVEDSAESCVSTTVPEESVEGAAEPCALTTMPEESTEVMSQGDCENAINVETTEDSENYQEVKHKIADSTGEFEGGEDENNLRSRVAPRVATNHHNETTDNAENYPINEDHEVKNKVADSTGEFEDVQDESSVALTVATNHNPQSFSVPISMKSVEGWAKQMVSALLQPTYRNAEIVPIPAYIELDTGDIVGEQEKSIVEPSSPNEKKGSVAVQLTDTEKELATEVVMHSGNLETSPARKKLAEIEEARIVDDKPKNDKIERETNDVETTGVTNVKKSETDKVETDEEHEEDESRGAFEENDVMKSDPNSALRFISQEAANGWPMQMLVTLSGQVKSFVPDQILGAFEIQMSEEVNVPSTLDVEKLSVEAEQCKRKEEIIAETAQKSERERKEVVEENASETEMETRKSHIENRSASDALFNVAEGNRAKSPSVGVDSTDGADAPVNFAEGNRDISPSVELDSTDGVVTPVIVAEDNRAKSPSVELDSTDGAADDGDDTEEKYIFAPQSAGESSTEVRDEKVKGSAKVAEVSVHSPEAGSTEMVSTKEIAKVAEAEVPDEEEVSPVVKSDLDKVKTTTKSEEVSIESEEAGITEMVQAKPTRKVTEVQLPDDKETSPAAKIEPGESSTVDKVHSKVDGSSVPHESKTSVMVATRLSGRPKAKGFSLATDSIVLVKSSATRSESEALQQPTDAMEKKETLAVQIVRKLRVGGGAVVQLFAIAETPVTVPALLFLLVKLLLLLLTMIMILTMILVTILTLLPRLVLVPLLMLIVVLVPTLMLIPLLIIIPVLALLRMLILVPILLIRELLAN